MTDLINEGEIGSGTCGQVFKVRFKKTGHVIAVKVRPRYARLVHVHTLVLTLAVYLLLLSVDVCLRERERFLSLYWFQLIIRPFNFFN